MLSLPNNIINFFKNQGFVILSTIDSNGIPHASCKDIVDIEPEGKVYLLDVYMAKTFANLKNNQNASITVVDEHKFKGYCLKGRAKILDSDELSSRVIKAWDDKITSRMTHRLLKNIRGEKGHSHHPESQLPRPKYLICLEVSEIVDLTPPNLKKLN